MLIDKNNNETSEVRLSILYFIIVIWDFSFFYNYSAGVDSWLDGACFSKKIFCFCNGDYVGVVLLDHGFFVSPIDKYRR